MLYIVKRDGREVSLQVKKIFNAIKAASTEGGLSIGDGVFLSCTEKVIKEIEALERDKIKVEEVQNIVLSVLEKEGLKKVAKIYGDYREERTRVREIKSDLMRAIGKIGIETDRDNANVGNNFSSKLLRIASESNKWSNLARIPKNLSKAHEMGDLHYHDLDSYNLTINCLHIPTGEILNRGFNTGYGRIEKPKRIETAAQLSCILLQASQNDMFGGQSHPDFDNDLGEYVTLTREEIKIENKNLRDDEIENKLRKRVAQAMQGVVYNLNTMHSRAGSQVPFSSVNIGIPKNKDSALVCEIFLLQYEKGLGKGEQPIFPNIIFRVKEGINRDEKDPYYYLFQLACKVAGKRMNPTFMNIDADFNKEYYDRGIMPATMGCRTYIMKNINGEDGCVKRGNIAPVTINLPRIGILSKGSEERFFQILKERIELSKEALLNRYNTLKKLKVKDIPFVAGEGLLLGAEGLNSEDSIEPILKQGTYGVGFIGLAEALVALRGKHHGEDEVSRELGERIISFLRKELDRISEETRLNWSCYATPAEGLSGRFIKQDKMKFGEIKGVTDREYYTNSFHVPVYYKSSIVNKINIEAPYHRLCNGGHISYVEVDGTPGEKVVMDIIKYAYTKTNISYMGINFHIRYCKDCGSSLNGGEEYCLSCGSRNIQGISRVTGYLSLDERFGEGKAKERQDRLSHV